RDCTLRCNSTLASLFSSVQFFLSSLFVSHFFFFSIIPLPPRSTLFPYTTLFRSAIDDQFVNVNHLRLLTILFRQRNQFLGTMCDEKRIESFLFHQFFENVLRYFVISQLWENFHVQVFRPLPPLFA